MKRKKPIRKGRSVKPRQLPQKAETKMALDMDKLTIGEAKALIGLFGGSKSPTTAYKEGEKYFIRTVTHYYTGRLVKVTDKELVLLDAAWIADTGRLAEFLSKGVANEVEPYPDGCEVKINRDSIIDGSDWPHALPRVVK